jgi:hypothetical protein
VTDTGAVVGAQAVQQTPRLGRVNAGNVGKVDVVGVQQGPVNPSDPRHWADAEPTRPTQAIAMKRKTRRCSSLATMGLLTMASARSKDTSFDEAASPTHGSGSLERSPSVSGFGCGVRAEG